MSPLKSWCLLLAPAFVAAGCHARPPAVAPTRAMASTSAVTPRPPSPAPPAAAARPTAAPLSEAELFGRKSLDELNAEHPLADVFFDYDQNELRDDATRVLQMDAQWLAKWPQTRIRIDGHCDERGTPEYNLALGDRRAIAVRSYLTSLGVRPDRIQIRSLGNEAPFCRDSGESCWSQNRRGHFVITEK
jgi:peptidoglycan-associated lipoprotein